MKTIFTYDELKKKAAKNRAELFQKGLFDPSRGKVRRKPRTKQDLDMLYRRAIERVKTYKPYFDRAGKLILPYFYRTKTDRETR
jgi:hypothetical protein